MRYFRDFPKTLYKFGNQTSSSVFTDISIFSEVLDELKDQESVYQKFSIIDGMRPDQVSDEIYGTPIYHWTFYILNDLIRERGWPLDADDLLDQVKDDFPDTAIRTRFDLTGSSDFVSGASIRGTTSGTVATISHRKLDLGLIIVTGTHSFTNGETVELVSDITKTFTLDSFSAEHLSAHHFEDADGNYVDITPTNEDPGIFTKKTNFDFYKTQNDELKLINVIKPGNIGSITSAFKQSIGS